MKKIYVVWIQYRDSNDYDFDGAFSDIGLAKMHQIKIATILNDNGYKPGNYVDYLDSEIDCYVNIEIVEIKDYLYETNNSQVDF